MHQGRAAESYWSRYHSWGKLSVRADNGIAVVELSGSPGEPLICSMVEASLGRIAELAGARNTTTTHPQCVRDGNPACMFGVRWSAR